ncbi:hypothetical protein GOV08_02370 [Candidatus Woesearchaeota archaeon]|nr:hypothetical protein [Candidatus Woesearchaeota archaeon]
MQKTLYHDKMLEENTQTNSTFAPSLVQKTVGSKGGIFIFFIAVLIYIVDFVWLRFDGINIVNALRHMTVPNFLYDIVYKGIVINVVFWIILVFVYFFRKPENKEEFLSVLLLVAATFFVVTLAGLNRIAGLSNLGALIHLLFIFFGLRNGVLTKKFSKIDANYYTILIIFLDFFAFNLINSIFPWKEIQFVNRIVIPLLPISTLIYIDESTFRNYFLFGITIFYILLVLHTYSVNANYQELLSRGEIESGQEALDKAGGNLMNFWKGILTGWNESQAIIRGDYYTGQVEQYENEPLGVFLEDVEASDEVFLQNETITIWANLKAYTLEDKEIKVNVSCALKNGTKWIEGSISPSRVFTVNSYDEEFITCNFGQEVSSEPGYHNVIFNATFDFKTQSYLKTYYIEKERKRTLTSQDIDILTEYEITERDPVARFTAGPLKMGMETTTPPVGVPKDEKEAFSSYIGLTLDNNWDGNVIKLNSVSLTLPSGLTFDKNICTYFDGSGSNYNLKSDEITQDNKKEFSLPKSYKCSLKLDNSNNLLGSTPISIKYFKADVDYTYQIQEKTRIQVKKSG